VGTLDLSNCVGRALLACHFVVSALLKIRAAYAFTPCEGESFWPIVTLTDDDKWSNNGRHYAGGGGVAWTISILITEILDSNPK